MTKAEYEWRKADIKRMTRAELIALKKKIQNTLKHGDSGTLLSNSELEKLLDDIEET